MERYITLSIELHLFFARIMKEHSFFLEAGFPPKYEKFIKRADYYKNEFEKLLYDVARISHGFVRPSIRNSHEIVTPYTLSTETKTENLTGIPINKDITVFENNLFLHSTSLRHENIESLVKTLNNRALSLVNGLITLKEQIISEILACRLFNTNYLLLIEHILREAELYRDYIVLLESGEDIEKENIKNTELFWNRIMMEHALFIRGLLDPTEGELINTANDFANEYNALIEEVKIATDEMMPSLTQKTITETINYRDFKRAATEGLDACKIRSIILPLLADHVLREANHYLRLLETK